MSNRSIIERLELELDQYKTGRISRNQIGKQFYDHIEALEGIPYSVILQARNFRYELEVDGYYIEEGFESKSDELLVKIHAWLAELRKTYC